MFQVETPLDMNVAVLLDFLVHIVNIMLNVQTSSVRIMGLVSGRTQETSADAQLDSTVSSISFIECGRHLEIASNFTRNIISRKD